MRILKTTLLMGVALLVIGVTQQKTNYPPINKVEAQVAQEQPKPVEIAVEKPAEKPVEATPAPVQAAVVQEPAPAPKPAPVVTGSHQDWMTQAGIPPSEWVYVDYIASRESGWRPDAVNASSGACGLFQQLRCGKWAHQWNDPVGAIIDATGYAQSRYGSWAAAYLFWTKNHYW